MTYSQIGQSAPNGIPKVEVKIKTRTHEAGEDDGLEYEGEGGGCEDQEHKFEGGKFKGNFLVHAKSTKENPWIGFKEELLPKEKIEFDQAWRPACGAPAARCYWGADPPAAIRSLFFVIPPRRSVSAPAAAPDLRECRLGMERYELSGKVALVTGGARGIGFATARALIGRGASVAIADLDPEATARSASQLHDSRAIGVAADVTDRGAIQRAVAETVERFGGLDVVVANAGIASRVATFRAMPTETFQRVIDVDLFGVVPHG